MKSFPSSDSQIPEEVEIEVVNRGHNNSTEYHPENDIHKSIDDYSHQSRLDKQQEKSKTKFKFEAEEKSAKTEEKKYGWAFFLASMFVGLGLTTVTDSPLPLFMGMGVGFLFFVDPIYEKVMNLINQR